MIKLVTTTEEYHDKPTHNVENEILIDFPIIQSVIVINASSVSDKLEDVPCDKPLAISKASFPSLYGILGKATQKRIVLFTNGKVYRVFYNDVTDIYTIIKAY